MTILILFSSLAYGYETTGGTQTTDGTDVIHTFTSNGTFEIVGGGTLLNVSILIVAGGGAGGTKGGGGGGAGGVYYLTGVDIEEDTLDVVVGKGGVPNANANGGNGFNSSCGSYIAVGGGGGGGESGSYNGSSGGSGGGSTNAGGTTSDTCHEGYNVSNQGFSGGGCVNNCGDVWGCTGGGGGASQVGMTSTHAQAGHGGNGTAYSISGTSVYYGGGAGGTCYNALNGVAGIGGLGGGANGTAPSGSPIRKDGTNGTGGGGGAGYTLTLAGFGGNGVVIIRYSNTTIEENQNISEPAINYYDSWLWRNEELAIYPDYDLAGVHDSTHGLNMTVNINCSIDPDEEGSVLHNLYVVNSTGSLIYTIAENLTCPGDEPINITWDNHAVDDGFYYMNITARATDEEDDVVSYMTPNDYYNNNYNLECLGIDSPLDSQVFNLTDPDENIEVNFTYRLNHTLDMKECRYGINASFSDYSLDLCLNFSLNFTIGNYLWVLQTKDDYNFVASCNNLPFTVCYINYTCADFSMCYPENVSYCEDVQDYGLCGYPYEGNISDYDMNCTYVPTFSTNTTLTTIDLTVQSNVILFGLFLFFWIGLAIISFTFRNFIFASMMFFVGVLLGFWSFSISWILSAMFLLFSALLMIKIAGFK